MRFLLLGLLLLCVGPAAHGLGVEYAGPQTEAAIRDDPEVYMVEVYSRMCGSCQDFAPTWEKFVNKNAKKFKFVGVNVDTKPGMAYAQKIGAMKGGIPAVLMFKAQGAAPPVEVVAGDVPTLKALGAAVRAALGHALQSQEGYYLKAPSFAAEL